MQILTHSEYRGLPDCLCEGGGTPHAVIVAFPIAPPWNACAVSYAPVCAECGGKTDVNQINTENVTQLPTGKETTKGDEE